MSLTVEQEEFSATSLHEPVMTAETVALLSAVSPALIVDATVGTGGHATELLKATDARLLGLDCDAQALAVAAERLAQFGRRVELRQANFVELENVLDEARLGTPGAILVDLGMSSFALDDRARGFSFRHDGPLDMRTDRRQKLSARDLVNEESESDLAAIIYEYGEERASRRIARAIVEARRQRPIETTRELAALVELALGGRRPGGIHPATRTFQALRIAVNDEIGNLRAMLECAPASLAPGGRMAVIAYHSLEDRIVKQRMRELRLGGGFALVTRRPLRPTEAEVARNPRARSARLRCVERSAS